MYSYTVEDLLKKILFIVVSSDIVKKGLQKMEQNTLVLGNGFSKVIFNNMPSWESLFKNVKSNIKNYTILYEVNMLKAGRTDEEAKKEIINEIKKIHTCENIKQSIKDLDKFGEYLFRNNVNNIITTNYDEGIELILCKKCGYQEVVPRELKREEIYSIRTYKEFVHKEKEHHIKLWKIHGDASRIKSIMLGFDQYCGSLAKLSEYIKGKYSSEKGPKCEIEMKQKCKEQKFDNLSWAELFFNTNVYIVGLGMDFSEIDIWWLLNKHSRIKREVPKVENNIFYLYNSIYDDKTKKGDIFEALDAFDVVCQDIKSDENYIRNIFERIK